MGGFVICSFEASFDSDRAPFLSISSSYSWPQPLQDHVRGALG